MEKYSFVAVLDFFFAREEAEIKERSKERKPERIRCDSGHKSKGGES